MSHAEPVGPAADRNLLFGILAVQMDFVGRDELIAAMNDWVLAKHRPLGEILVERGALTVARRALLEGLVAEHLCQHGNSPARSLAALGPSADLAARETLRQVDDPDVQASLSRVPEAQETVGDPGRTVAHPGGERARFRVLRAHAKGGLGEVFVARDDGLNRRVALKEIQARYADDPGSRRRFLQEAEVTGGLEHPGVVPVYELGRHPDGRPYYAMRFVEGEDLRQAIERFHAPDRPGRDAERRLTFRELLGRFVHVCQTVAFAHSKGVLHRDLKPANIMLGKYGETLVVDWGLAKSAGTKDAAAPAEETVLPPRPADDATPTRAGSALGTPAYMSPEQAARRPDQMGPASDIYSLGATLYSLLTGKAPVEGADIAEVRRRVQAGAIVPPRQAKPGTPAALDAVCRKAMALRPEDRYASALDLAADVERWLADEPVGAYREPWPARAGRWVRRHRTPVAGAAAAVVVSLLLGGAGLVWQQREQARRRAGAEAALARVVELQGRERWAEARAALEQAEDRLGAGGPDELRRRLEATRRDLELVARLDDLRLVRASRPQGGPADRDTTERDYEAAFAEAGLGRPGDDPDVVAGRVAGSAVREVLVAALDDWALLAAGPKRAWALEVARRADPDPWRDRLREPAAWEDDQALAKRARETPPAAATPGLAGAVGGRLRRVGEGEGLLRAAQALRPEDFWLNLSLASVLRANGRWKEAEGFERAALALRPESSSAHNNLGVSLYHQGKLAEAADRYRKAMELDAHNGYAPFNLTRVLLAQGQYPPAGDAARRAIALLPAADPLRPQAEALLQQALLGERLDAVLRGEQHPASAAEGVAFGELCFARQRYADAVRLFAGAFAADPKLAADLRSKHRYNAACYAALAGCGKGEGAPGPEGPERAKLRAQALVWLRADLALRARQLSAGPADKAEATKKLRLWQRDEDLSGVRDPAGLAQLPETERKEWEALWAEVRALLTPPRAVAK